MAQPELRELAIAQFIDAGFLDDPDANITAEMVRAKNPWKGGSTRASLQWATKILFGAKFAKELREEAGEKAPAPRKNIIGGKRKDIGGSGILVTKRRTV